MSTSLERIRNILLIVSLSVSVATTADEVNTDTFIVNTVVTVNVVGPQVNDTRIETIFRGTEVYDTNKSDPTDTVAKFDLAGRIVRLIDRKTRSQTVLSFKEIGEFQAGACAKAVAQKGTRDDVDRLLAFMAQPQFKYVFDPTARSIRLSSPLMTYEAIGLPQQGPADLVDRFTEFADWSKQLSTVLDNGAPAQARLRLNRKLRERNFQVARVRLNIAADAVSGSPEYEATSQHSYSYGLTPIQRDFIEDVEKQLETFKQVSFSTFLATRKSAHFASKK